MENYVLNIIIVGVISWTSLFLVIRKLLPNRSFEFCNRLVSTCHAILILILASLSVDDWSCPVCPLASPSSPNQMKTLAVTMGYLIYDLICSQFDARCRSDNTIHHLFCIFGLFPGFAYKKSGAEMVAALFIAELSRPLLHLREFLKQLGHKDTDLDISIDILFGVVFSIARMVVGPYLTYVILSASNPLNVKASAMGMQLISAYWFYKIWRMIYYKLTKRNASKKFS